MEDTETQTRAWEVADQASENMRRIDAEYERVRRAALIKFLIGMLTLIVAFAAMAYIAITGGTLWM